VFRDLNDDHVFIPGGKRPMNATARNVMLNSFMLITSLLCGLVSSEIIARMFLEPPPGYAVYSRERTAAHDSLQRMVSDPRLLHRLSPQSPGHDGRGFRNPDTLQSADVVVIGDSQTWGINVRASETWPSILETIGNVSVYSMSLGGWGPVQYKELAHDALTLKPRAILVGIYLGNDIFDACNHVYGTDVYAEYRRSDADYSSLLSDLHGRIKVTNDQGRVDHTHERLAEMGNVAKMWQSLARRSLILQILMVRGFLPAVPSVDDLYQMADEVWAQEHPEFASVYNGGNYSTVLTYGYRGVAVDLENACIRDGVRITKEVLTSLKALGDRFATQVGILFIPTKELVYATADQALLKRTNGKLAELVKNEHAIKIELLDHCNSLGIVCIDAAAGIVKAARNGVVLYRADSDGHPIAEGYRQIALAGQQALKAMGILER
jgi:hypothetical protein